MEKLIEFVAEHLNDDTARLILDRARWPGIDMSMAVSCIESRRKLKGKVQEWYDEPGLVFPAKLSAEQCSSSATARYKASLAAGIAGHRFRIADLTGGLGVDSWFFSQDAEEVLHNEMQKTLCEAARHNFSVMKAGNIRISNHAVVPDGYAEDPDEASPTSILSDFFPDIVYMDPARRGEGGKKVFLIEECTPDVLKLKDEIFRISRHILLKLSPMADITMVCNRLGRTCREVHVVASGGECKELLIWMDREWDDEYTVHAVELVTERDAAVFSFTPSEETNAAARTGKAELHVTSYLFEPGKALMKAGAFNLISTRFGINKLGRSTHYYIIEDHSKAMELKKYGKVFRILQSLPLDKRSIKAAGKEYPKADVTARNIPMDTDALRKRLGVSSGDLIHIFGIRSDSDGNLLIVTQKAL